MLSLGQAMGRDSSRELTDSQLLLKQMVLNIYIVQVDENGYSIPAFMPVPLTSTWQQISISGVVGNGLNTLIFQIGGGPSFVSGQVIDIWNPTMEDMGIAGTSVTNAILFSQRFSASSWISPDGRVADNVVTAPDGTMTAAALTGSNDDGKDDTCLIDTLPNPAPFSGLQVTGSIWMRVPSGNKTVSLTLVEDNANQTNIFPLGSQNFLLTMDWQRFQVSGTTQSNLDRLNLQVGGDQTIRNGDVVQVWGAQIELASTAGPYVATAGAPVTHGTNFTNVSTYSQQLNQPNWDTSGGTHVSLPSTAAPDGTMTGNAVTGTSGVDSNIGTVVPNPSLYDGETVTASVYLRVPSGSRTLGLYFYALNAAGIQFVNPTTVNLTNVWQRFSFTGTLPTGLLRLAFNIGGAQSWTDGSEVDIWGAQIEVSPHMGPYVATSALPVTTGGQYTNILSNSQMLNGPSWMTADMNPVTVDTQNPAPDGSFTAAVVTAIASAPAGETLNPYLINVVPNPSLYDQQVVTASIYLRTTNGTTLTPNLYLVPNGNLGSDYGIHYPVTITGQWQRFTITGNMQNGMTSLLFFLGAGQSIPANASFEVWGAQMVIGTDPGSYMPTGGTTTVAGSGSTTTPPTVATLVN
jgi:hypothetical protein